MPADSQNEDCEHAAGHACQPYGTDAGLNDNRGIAVRDRGGAQSRREVEGGDIEGCEYDGTQERRAF